MKESSLEKFAKTRGNQMDTEIEVLRYRIEARMFYVNYKNFPLAIMFEKFKNDVSKYMWDAFRYRMVASNIMCIISTWEQQLFNFCNNFIGKVDNNYGNIRDKFLGKYKAFPNLFDDIDETNTRVRDYYIM